MGCSVSRAHKTWSRSLLFKDFLGTEPRFERAETLMSRNACDGEKSPEGWRFKLDAKSGPLESGDFSDFGNFGNNGKFYGENGEKSPEGWRFKLDAKSGPLESGVGD